MRSESPLVIQGNRVKKDSLTAEDVYKNKRFCSKAFLFMGFRNLKLVATDFSLHSFSSVDKPIQAKNHCQKQVNFI